MKNYIFFVLVLVLVLTTMMSFWSSAHVVCCVYLYFFIYRCTFMRDSRGGGQIQTHAFFDFMVCICYLQLSPPHKKFILAF